MALELRHDPPRINANIISKQAILFITINCYMRAKITKKIEIGIIFHLKFFYFTEK